MGLGQIQELLFAVTQSHTEYPSRTKGQERVDYLEAQALGILPGIDKGPPPLEPVIRPVYQPEYEGKGHERHGKEMEKAYSPHKEEYHHPASYNHRGPEVRLEEDQYHEGAHHYQVGQEPL